MPASRTRQPRRITLVRLLACATIATAGVAPYLPPWTVVFAAAVLGWQALAIHRSWPLPSRTLRLLLAAASFAGVIVTFGRINGQSAGAALLCVMLALKFTELRTRRDGVVVLLLAYFALATACLFSQSLPTLLYLAAGTWLITAVLLDVTHDGQPLPTVATLRQSALMLAQALPVMLALFVLFPRIPGPLWALPSAPSAHTGLSDRMTPGGIAHLARSGAVAFRVRFQGTVPPRDQRYWRGPVLWAFNGRTWKLGAPARLTTPMPTHLEPRGKPTNYTVTLEADDARWLLALDIPVSGPDSAVFTRADQMRALTPVRQRRLYHVRSYLHYRLHPEPLSPEIRHAALQLPARVDPRTRALVRRWLNAGYHGDRLVKRALRFFHRQDFVYTLNPPLLRGRNTVDEFVFDTRKGFCEHFAGAFTFMMRVGGIPARVVTGYQGGRINHDGDYMIVRQSDAHAWSEVWLPKRGWVRVDPTAAVDPARVQLGLGAALPNDSQVPPMARLGGGWLKALNLRWDWVNMMWNQAVLAYGPRLQMAFLSRLGLGSWQRMILALTGACSGFLALLGLFIVWNGAREQRRDPVERAWRTVCRRLARRGLARREAEGPSDYAARVANACPQWRDQIHMLSNLYLRARYGDDTEAARLFLQATRTIRLR